MSRASEWAEMTEHRPEMTLIGISGGPALFLGADDDGDLFVEGEDGKAITYVTSENAVAVAHWLLDTFGEP